MCKNKLQTYLENAWNKMSEESQPKAMILTHQTGPQSGWWFELSIGEHHHHPHPHADGMNGMSYRKKRDETTKAKHWQKAPSVSAQRHCVIITPCGSYLMPGR